MTEAQEPPYGHESSAIADRRVIVIGVILAVLLLGAALVLHAVLQRTAPHHARVVARPGAVPPAPRLEVDPRKDLAAFETQKKVLLASWDWTDSTQTFARIPIERAIEIYARQQADSAKAPSKPPRRKP